MDWKRIQKNMTLLSRELGVMSAYFLLHGTPLAHADAFDARPRFFQLLKRVSLQKNF